MVIFYGNKSTSRQCDTSCFNFISSIFDFEKGRLFEAGSLLTFLAIRVGAHSRWAIINFFGHLNGRSFEMGAHSNKYSNDVRSVRTTWLDHQISSLKK